MGTRLFQMLVNDGEIPAPVKIGGKTLRWHWLDILAVSQVLKWKNEGRYAGAKKQT